MSYKIKGNADIQKNLRVGGSVFIDDGGTIKIPVGDTSTRPTSPVAGMLQYNLDISEFEYYDGSSWVILSSLGPTGFTGSQGIQGVIGFTGSQGVIGFTGSMGPVAGNNSELIYNDNGVSAGTSNINYVKSTGFLGFNKQPTVELDVAGSIAATGFIGSLHGNASTASKLLSPIDISVSGDGYTGSVSFDGSTNITIPLIPNIISFTKTITIGTEWQDVGINGDDLATGSYVVQLYANDVSVGGFNNNEYYTGFLSWTDAQTQNSPELFADEIVLHRAGQSSRASLFLRTYRSNGPDKLKLQIFSNYTTTGSANYVFRFRKFI